MSSRLRVDPFGNVLKQAAIGYGRRKPDLSLPLPADRDKQTRTLITYTESRITHPIDDPVVFPDDYRVPLPCETRVYELSGYTAAGRFRSDSFVKSVGPELVHVFDTEIAFSKAFSRSAGSAA